MARLSRCRDNTVSGSGSTGIYLVNPGNVTALANDVTGNAGAGIYVSNQVSGTTAVVGAMPGRRRRQRRQPATPATASTPITTSWCWATRSRAPPGPRRYGIYLYGASAIENVVYGNTTGIREAQPGGFVDQNRVYDNSGAGIIMDFARHCWRTWSIRTSSASRPPTITAARSPIT